MAGQPGPNGDLLVQAKTLPQKQDREEPSRKAPEAVLWLPHTRTGHTRTCIQSRQAGQQSCKCPLSHLYPPNDRHRVFKSRRFEGPDHQRNWTRPPHRTEGTPATQGWATRMRTRGRRPGSRMVMLFREKPGDSQRSWLLDQKGRPGMKQGQGCSVYTRQLRPQYPLCQLDQGEVSGLA